ncbi:MAG: helix-turn-helix domain-containing protein [Ktedonobacteraceae bacterium]|nr:helix-turn-helix domain-containing protein [Ktedonobacteraceae bacterium]
MAKNELLIQARTEKGWLQKEVAERLGVSEVTVRRWEQGRVLPFRLHQQRLCELYQKSAQELGLMPAEAGRSFSSSLEARLINDPLLPTRAPIPLVGRDDVIHEVVSILLAGKTPIVLHGLPGVGKTALATMIAHDPSIRAHFHDGILWASLGSHPHMLSLLGR